MKTVFVALLAISSLAIVITTLIMEPKQQGMDGVFGGSGSVHNTARSAKESLLQKITIIAAVVFMISALVLAAL